PRFKFPLKDRTTWTHCLPENFVSRRISQEHRMSLDPRKAFALQLKDPRYPSEAPYAPSEPYPERPSKEEKLSVFNPVYGGLRALFQDMGLDLMHFGAPEWNPLGDWIKPGQNVVLKPNLVIHFHEQGGSMESV